MTPQVFKYGYNDSLKDQVVGSGTDVSSDTDNYFYSYYNPYQPSYPLSIQNEKKTVTKSPYLKVIRLCQRQHTLPRSFQQQGLVTSLEVWSKTQLEQAPVS